MNKKEPVQKNILRKIIFIKLYNSIYKTNFNWQKITDKEFDKISSNLSKKENKLINKKRK